MNLTDLENYDQGLAKRVELLLIQIKNLGAKEGAQRYTLVARNFKRVSISEAYRLIDPNALQQEVEEAQARKYHIRFFHAVRNCLALGPLILTWFALYQASTNYQQDLKKYPNDLYEPFLKLWQYGFHNTTWFTFATAALIDVGLLVSYLVSILLVMFLESRAQRKSQQFAVGLRGVTDEFMDAIAKAGTASASDRDRIIKTIETVFKDGFDKLLKSVKAISQADTEKIADALKQVLEDTLKESELVAQEAQKMISELNADLGDLVKQLHNDLGTLSSDLLGYDKQVQDLTDASTKLANASTSLATNANDLTKSTQEYTDIGRDISSQIGSLHGTQQQLITTFENIERNATTQIAAFAGNMDAAAKATEKVAQDLGQNTLKDINNMTKHVTDAADRIADAADALAHLQRALAQSDKHLQWALSQTDKHLQLTLSQVDQHLQRSIVDVNAQLQTTNAGLQQAAQALAYVTSLLKGGRGQRGKKRSRLWPF